MNNRSRIQLMSLFAATVAVCAEKPMLPSGWRMHDNERPQPEKVTAGKTDSDAPSDAIILFDGTSMNAWESKDGGPVKWTLEKGYMEVVPRAGHIVTKQAFGDIQLHLEWMTPPKNGAKPHGLGNSGVFLMDRYEIQIHDSWENPVYPDGMAGAVYGQFPALVNASKAPGEWQSFDIVFKAPVFKEDKLVSPAKVTVFQNGVLIQNHTEPYGPNAFTKPPSYKPHAEKMPLRLQDHGQKVRFRNIWVREL
ncbi:3-keto-disaccharide hydrolase [Pontiella agarivorans]|uniref:DUF1080 domain-containing protein n=1 Tax=Pontiella agarivorans TaxID=3038953 RepID=A0ABU5MX48_9BACT|nr:DUF1080 domain-containing protein [Pontiella agarivorans]MDZ8118774.1 DUF1080 domain-containing protein [Pontiella agarivorans]